MSNKHTYDHALITNNIVIDEDMIKGGILFNIGFDNNR